MEVLVSIPFGIFIGVLIALLAGMLLDQKLNKIFQPNYQEDLEEVLEEEENTNSKYCCDDAKELGFCNCNDVEPTNNSCNINDPECSGCDG